MKKQRKNLIQGLIMLLLAASLAACGTGGTQTPALPEETAAVTQPEATEEPVLPTPTTAPPAVILIAPPDADPDLAIQTQAALQALATESGLELANYTTLTPDLIVPGVQVVVGVGPAVDLTALAAGNPGVQFVALGQPGSVPGGNLSVIGDTVVDQESQSFMAGYLTALVSADYKVAGLVASDKETTNAAVNAYVIGARFFCGLCNPKYPPYNSFPQWEVLPTGSAPAAYQPVVDSLVTLGVEVVYLDGALVSSDLVGYLSDAGLKVVGGAASELSRTNWVGTVALDPGPALTALWADLLTGVGGQKVPMSVTLKDLDAGLVSEGRLLRFDEVLADLEAGVISPEFTP